MGPYTKVNCKEWGAAREPVRFGWTPAASTEPATRAILVPRPLPRLPRPTAPNAGARAPPSFLRTLPPCPRALPQSHPRSGPRVPHPPPSACPDGTRARALRPPCCPARASPLAPGVRWAGRRADVARDAGRFRRRLRRLRLACHWGLYENAGRRAARSPPFFQRAAAGAADAEPGCCGTAQSLPAPRPEPVSAPLPAARPSRPPLRCGLPACPPPLCSTPASASRGREKREGATVGPPLSASWDPASPHLTGCVTLVSRDEWTGAGGKPLMVWGFGWFLENAPPRLQCGHSVAPASIPGGGSPTQFLGRSGPRALPFLWGWERRSPRCSAEQS